MRFLLSVAATAAATMVVGGGLSLAQAPSVSPDALTPASAPTSDPVAPARPQLRESVAAVVNDEIISTYDLRQRTLLLLISSGVQPNEQTLPAIEREALRGLIDEHLQSQELRSIMERNKGAKLYPTEKELDAEIDDMAARMRMDRKSFTEALRRAGVDVRTLRERNKIDIAWQRYIVGRFSDNIHISDDQVRAELARANALAAKPQYNISEVFIDASHAGGMAQALEGARQLYDQIQKGAPFAAVAQQFSALPTAANGGDAGWLTVAAMPKEIVSAVESLRPGEVSQPIPAQDGVYLVLLKDKRAGGKATVLNLKQAAIQLQPNADAATVANAQKTLEELRGRIKGCDDLEAQAAKAPGVVAGDLGDTDVAELRPEFQAAVQNLQPGQVSPPVRTQIGLHLLAVCGRRVAGAQPITREDIENRIRGEQYSMIARRYMRDLRNSANIESR